MPRNIIYCEWLFCGAKHLWWGGGSDLISHNLVSRGNKGMHSRSKQSACMEFSRETAAKFVTSCVSSQGPIARQRAAGSKQLQYGILTADRADLALKRVSVAAAGDRRAG